MMHVSTAPSSFDLDENAGVVVQRKDDSIRDSVCTVLGRVCDAENGDYIGARTIARMRQHVDKEHWEHDPKIPR